MKVVALIPARMGSTRFPGKPLAEICQLSMIEHVRRRASFCKDFDKVIVATCDQEIFDHVKANGGEVVMTGGHHERCTDRIAEAAEAIEGDVFVNIQGDEPFIVPEMFSLLLEPLNNDSDCECTNLMTPITSEKDFLGANVVKVVTDRRGRALYMSREPIPTRRYAPNENLRFMQLGIMAFTKNYLFEFTKLDPTNYEKAESVDMMRPIEHGLPVQMVVSPFKSIGVDTIEDLASAEILMKEDVFYKENGGSKGYL